MADEQKFASRAGLKLDHALTEFAVDVQGLACADFGCNVGGFTDCLLQRGAARVFAVDTGYGALAWTLRNDARVVVMERTNALHARLPDEIAGGADLVVVDLAWTPQRHAIPAAVAWLKAGGRIISLIKPHYEARGSSIQAERTMLHDGALSESDAELICERILGECGEWGVRLGGVTRSPITGGKSSRGRGGAGNIEFLAHFERL